MCGLGPQPLADAHLFICLLCVGHTPALTASGYGPESEYIILLAVGLARLTAAVAGNGGVTVSSSIVHWPKLCSSHLSMVLAVDAMKSPLILDRVDPAGVQTNVLAAIDVSSLSRSPWSSVIVVMGIFPPSCPGQFWSPACTP